MGKAEHILGVDDTHCTPRYLLDPIEEKLGPIGLDPCSHPRSVVNSELAVMLPLYQIGVRPDVMLETYAKGARMIEFGDGFAKVWNGHGLVFVNSPYSELDRWLWKAAHDGDEVLMLAPVRTGNVGWAPAFTADIECRLGRVTHHGLKTHAAFHQAFLYWGPARRLPLVEEVLSQLGDVRLHPRWTRSAWSEEPLSYDPSWDRFRIAA